MIIDDVEEYHQPARMRSVDQGLKIVRPTVCRVGRIEQHTVIAPVAAAAERGKRHQFNRRKSGLGDMVELVDCCAKGTFGRERTDVKL
jgi:hypothetical protein